MNSLETFERKTGFDAVRRAVTALCRTHPGRLFTDPELPQGLTFSADRATVESRLCATVEMLGAVNTSSGSGPLPLGELSDQASRLAQLEVAGAVLTPADVLELRRLAAMSSQVSRFLAARSDGGDLRWPALARSAEPLGQFDEELRMIDAVIDRHGEVRDSASPELAEIRRRLQQFQGQASRVIRRIMAQAVAEGLIEEGATPAVRDGRPVIPVSAANKRRIPGIVHDESATGRTVFIEPAEVVEVNNRMRQTRLEEQREVMRIMAELTASLRPSAPELAQSYDALGELDFIRAKALFAMQLGTGVDDAAATEVIITPDSEPEMEWFHACHPILKMTLEQQGKQIVPLDIRLTPEQRILVISGPNAGGKSVCLKTVGCLQLMVQTGMIPPVWRGSRFCLFDNLMIDIGDDQSIADDLSTYSSHLSHMRDFLRRGTGRSLMLIDEFGSGTEPQIGGAIAASLLEEFNRRGMWGVITTHYHTLKQMAEDTPGLVNGSMLYDRQRMEPLFKLLIGSPGSSFALEIARRMGLPAGVIDRAREMVGSDYVNMDKYLLDIARDRRYWEQKRLEIKRKERETEALLERYRQEADTLRRSRREIMEEAREQARKIIEGSNAAVERTISEIRRAQAEKEATQRARRELERERVETDRRARSQKETNELLRKAPKSRREKPKAPAVPSRPLEVGSVVKLAGQSIPGRILEIDGDKATVAFGLLKTTVSLSRLTHTDAQIKSGSKETASFISAQTAEADRRRQLAFKTELDLRGMRADEAVQAVTYYLDDAIRFSSERVRLLHGTGTGALRHAIRQYLATHPGVAAFGDEDVRLGGAGITIVNLK